MGYFSLPTGKLLQKTKKKRLKNFPAGYIEDFTGTLLTLLIIFGVLNSMRES